MENVCVYQQHLNLTILLMGIVHGNRNVGTFPSPVKVNSMRFMSSHSFTFANIYYFETTELEPVSTIGVATIVAELYYRNSLKDASQVHNPATL